MRPLSMPSPLRGLTRCPVDRMTGVTARVTTAAAEEEAVAAAAAAVPVVDFIREEAARTRGAVGAAVVRPAIARRYS